MKLAFGSLYACALLVAPALADDAREAVQQGSFLPFTQSPANVSLVRSFGDYDSARRSTVVESDVQAKLSEKFQAQADLTYESGSIQPALALELSLLDEDKQAIDLQLGAGWTHSGFNQVGLAAQRERTAAASDVGVYSGAGLGGVF